MSDTLAFEVDGTQFTAEHEHKDDTTNVVIRDTTGAFVRRVLNVDSLAVAVATIRPQLAREQRDRNAVFVRWVTLTPFTPNGSRVGIAEWNNGEEKRYAVNVQRGNRWEPRSSLLNEQSAFRVFVRLCVELMGMENEFSDD